MIRFHDLTREEKKALGIVAVRAKPKLALVDKKTAVRARKAKRRARAKSTGEVRAQRN